MSSHLFRLTPIAMAISATVLCARPTIQQPVAAFDEIDPYPDLSVQDVLPVGKTAGTFHLNGLVKPDRTVMLRWANDQGEMPVEGVTIYRQRDGETSWKALNNRSPVYFLKGDRAEASLKRLPQEQREELLSVFFGDIQRDPVTRRRIQEVPKGVVQSAQDLKLPRVLEQYKVVRNAGKLCRSDMQLLTLKADMEGDVADLFGLQYEDHPSKGKWRYKIEVKLPEGGTAEAICSKLIDPSEPTPVPLAVNLSAKSGNGCVLLNWDKAPSDIISGFNVYRAGTSTGPWTRINEQPVKKVTLETEDPELVMRRSIAVQSAMEKELKRRGDAPITPTAAREIRVQAALSVAGAKDLPSLSPALSSALKEAVKSGRLRGGGPQTLLSVYTDSIQKAGNQNLKNEQTYYYKVTTVDICGGETPVEGAPSIAGIPKDLEPPKVPGRPKLQEEAEAQIALGTAQTARMKDPKLINLDQFISTKTPQPEQPQIMRLVQAEKDIPALNPLPPEMASMTLPQARRMQRSHMLATMPTAALSQLAHASVLHSNADGSIPPARLVWDASPDGDLNHYDVYRSKGKGGAVKVGTSLKNAWADTDLELSQSYHYTVTAVDNLGNVSAKSVEGTVDVSDSVLPIKATVKRASGSVRLGSDPDASGRSLIRPGGRIMKTTTLIDLPNQAALIKLPKSSGSSLVAEYKVPTLMKKSEFKPRRDLVAAPRVLDGTSQLLPVKGIQTAPKLSVVTKAFKRSPNLMLQAYQVPKVIPVVLEWDRPLPGFPMEYLIFQAPQRADFSLADRKAVKYLPAFSMLQAKSPTIATATPIAMTGPASPITMAGPATLKAAPMAISTMNANLLRTSPELHARVMSGLVATEGQGLVLSAKKKGKIADLLVKPEPGFFSQINEAPVTTERYTVTFPATVSQYGGSTFFFRIQAKTKEFGKVVEGLKSEVIEVRLPDILPPPPPVLGSIVLNEGAGYQFKVNCSWTQTKVKDLAGFYVERQPMNYQMIDGELKVGNPKGEPQQLNPQPLTADAYEDASPSGGCYRYTVRSVDKTGNRSEPQGAFDILIPGEPVPSAPADLVIAGGRLTWKSAKDAMGYTVWRSFTGKSEDYECISGVLGATATEFNLPPEGTLHLKVVARSHSGMHQIMSSEIVRNL